MSVIAAVLFSISLFSLPSFARKSTNTPACDAFKRSVTSGPAETKLKRFLDEQWKYRMTEFPEWATYVGYPGQNRRWTDRSRPALERRKVEEVCQLVALRRIPARALSQKDRVTHEMALRRLENSIEGHRFDDDVLMLDHLGGIHMSLPDLLMAMPRTKASDYEDILARLESFPAVTEQTEALLREGLKKGITPVKMFMAKVPAQFDGVLTPKPEDSPLLRPFLEAGAGLSEAERLAFREKGLTVIRERVYPALAKLKDFVVTQYIPGCREFISWSAMPDGKNWYAYLVKSSTTTNQTPEELHQIGLREVERLLAEMNKIREQVKFKGDLKKFNRFLLEDPQFYFKDPKDLMLAYRDIAKRIDPELPRLFKTLPRLPYGIREMPAYKAPSAPTAYYMSGSIEAGRAGFFEANTYDLKARPKWGMEALTIHEAVPGHHLQIALAQEVEGLPEFRRRGGYTAFVEGWALYSESLGEELGFYKDPYSMYGRHSYELWRAIRLVVDTGMHHLGWSREKALQYFMDLMPKTRLESEVEIDRYITWPGQALAYKVGQMKFVELREKARQTLGEKFDIRAYHDEVLRHGAVPLDVLDQLFNEWLGKQKKAEAAGRG